MTSRTAEIAMLLDSLGKRARSQEKSDLSSAVGILGDLARLVNQGRDSEIRGVQAAVAMLREQLDGEEVLNRPSKMLKGQHSHAYLAGAMWAVSEMMSARLRAARAESALTRSAARKEQITHWVLDFLSDGAPHSPSEIQADKRLADLGLRSDELSRILSGFLASGLISSVSGEPGVDRRRKFYVLNSESVHEEDWAAPNRSTRADTGRHAVSR